MQNFIKNILNKVFIYNIPKYHDISILFAAARACSVSLKSAKFFLCFVLLRAILLDPETWEALHAACLENIYPFFDAILLCSSLRGQKLTFFSNRVEKIVFSFNKKSKFEKFHKINMLNIVIIYNIFVYHDISILFVAAKAFSVFMKSAKKNLYFALLRAILLDPEREDFKKILFGLLGVRRRC